MAHALPHRPQVPLSFLDPGAPHHPLDGLLLVDDHPAVRGPSLRTMPCHRATPHLWLTVCSCQLFDDAEDAYKQSWVSEYGGCN